MRFTILCLMGVSLTGMYVKGVHLTGMHLIGMYLTDVRLTGVSLTGVHLIGILLIGIHLTGIKPFERVLFPLAIDERYEDVEYAQQRVRLVFFARGLAAFYP
jgi:hypothetical protein